jgi:hypothetical protein
MPKKGQRMSEEQKQHQSEVMEGRYSGENNPMYGRDRSGVNNPFYGKKHTDKSREMMSNKSKTKHVHSGETHYKNGESGKGL